MRSFRDTMWFSWIDDKLDRNPLLPQRTVKSGRLTERHARIVLSMQNEYRRRDITSEGNWAEFQVASPGSTVPGRAPP